ncbi:MAG: ATP-binding cassette domain-containing protein [Phycisphaeraceae bacterium]|nr:MAG: ATP-binding cassette domain-containing protein [Phycisphaeraceae bacterium]
MSDPAILIEGVTKRFRDKVAVDRLDLAVPAGSLCGFLGPNGAGKTTTIRMVMSIFLPDEGRISVLGRKSAIESKDRIGYLPEERGVYRKMKVGEFLTYIGTLKGVDRKPLSKWIDQWLDRVGLPEVRKKRCEELSKGMQQKVQFLATIIHDPDLIILDEPFSGLDPVNARLLNELIRELHDAGKTIIFSTHVLIQAEQMCDRIFMINGGKKILDGTVDEIRADHDPNTVVFEPSPGADYESTVRSIPGVYSLSMGDRGVVEAHLDNDADPRSVMRTIVERIPVRRVEVRRATLEDIFVLLVKPGDSEDMLRAALSGRAGAEALHA